MFGDGLGGFGGDMVGIADNKSLKNHIGVDGAAFWQAGRRRRTQGLLDGCGGVGRLAVVFIFVLARQKLEQRHFLVDVVEAGLGAMHPKVDFNLASHHLAEDGLDVVVQAVAQHIANIAVGDADDEAVGLKAQKLGRSHPSFKSGAVPPQFKQI